MAERKQVNKYYPPDFDPAKHKNINKYRNTHALRERAKKIDQGILVIRFEMPYNIWCEGCKIHIAMGVRYNAEKRKVGYYYTTPIYRFRMKCHLCENYFEIETDPMNCDYKIIIGAQRKNQKWDMADNEQVLTEDRQDVKRLATDPMFKLEHGVEDKQKLEKAAPSLKEIAEKVSGREDDYMQNRMLRDKFRKWKKEVKATEEADKSLLTKSSLDIELVPEHEDDKRLASLLKYQSVTSFEDNFKNKTKEIQNQSIFASQMSKKKSPTSSSGNIISPTLSSSTSPDAKSSLSNKNFLSEKFKFLKKGLSSAKAVFGISGFKRKKTEGIVGDGIVRKKRKTVSHNEERGGDIKGDESNISREGSSTLEDGKFEKPQKGDVEVLECVVDRLGVQLNQDGSGHVRSELTVAQEEEKSHRSIGEGGRTHPSCERVGEVEEEHNLGHTHVSSRERTDTLTKTNPVMHREDVCIRTGESSNEIDNIVITLDGNNSEVR